jgi:hypothetical protein
MIKGQAKVLTQLTSRFWTKGLVRKMKFLFFPEARGDLLSIILWSIIIICIILATIHLNNPAAYAIWIVLIMLVLMMKAQLIPSI